MTGKNGASRAGLYCKLTSGATIVMCLSLVAGCGGGGSKKADTITPTSTSPSTSSTSKSSSQSSAADLSGPALQSALLSVEDMPPGYAVQPPSTNSTNGYCPGHDPATAVQEQEKAQVTFSKSTFGPFVAQIIGRYADEDTAKRYMAAVRDAGKACQSWTDTDSSGSTQSNTLSPLSFEKFGDETFAMRLGTEGGFFPAGGDVVYVRHGKYVYLIGNVGVPSANTDDTVTFTKKADAKLTAAL